MRNIWILFKREMMAYFFSPIAYIVGVCVLATMGLGFSWIVASLVETPSEHSASMWFLNNFFYWIILLIVPPVITMRLFADEKRMGTIESLMTTPLRDTEYVLGKFLSAVAYFVLLWAPTLNIVFVLRHFSGDTTPVDLGPIVGGYLGSFLMGTLFIAAGCMASASTRNQIIAAVIGFGISFTLFTAGVFFYLKAADASRPLFEYFSMVEHMREMSRGLIEWKRVVFYLSGTAFFLFVTQRMVQARQWKS